MPEPLKIQSTAPDTKTKHHQKLELINELESIILRKSSKQLL